MLGSEEERVEGVVEDLRRAGKAGRKLKVDPASQSLKVVGPYDHGGQELRYTPEYGVWSGEDQSIPVITLPDDTVATCAGKESAVSVSFRQQDGGKGYSGLSVEHASEAVRGSICSLAGESGPLVEQVGQEGDEVRVLVWPRRDDSESPRRVKGYVRRNGQWLEARMEIVPVRSELFSRTRGLFETSALAAAQVLIIGTGSIGSAIAHALACLGLMRLFLADGERLEVVNVIRHAAGLSHVGRFKTKATAHVVLQRNPFAEVETREERVSWETEEALRTWVRGCDVAVCAAYDGTVEAVCNKVFVEERKPAIFPGAFRRAYGGQILRYKPGEGPCYHCLVRSLPGRAGDREVTGDEQARRLSYTDRVIEAEPGLLNDISPIVQMSVKLIIQQLLQGKETALRSLDDDLVAPYFLWLNRRERDTDYENLDPLEYNIDGLRILGWYGVDLKRDPDCSCCGDFLDRLIQREGLDISPADEAAFAGSECDR